MANNRMWLVCPYCKLGIMLGKNMAGGWYSAPTEERLNSFYDKHQECGVLEEPFVYLTEDGVGWEYDEETDDGWRFKLLEEE